MTLYSNGGDSSITIVHLLSANEFTMSGEIDSPLGYMDVHQVIDDPALDVPLVLVHDDLLSGIEYLEEAEVGFQVLVERLVLLFVVFDPRFEIFDHLRQGLVRFHHFYICTGFRIVNLVK